MGLAALTATLMRNRPAPLKCPHCGVSRDTMETSGLAGCPLCYEVFELVLKEYGALRGNWSQSEAW